MSILNRESKILEMIKEKTTGLFLSVFNVLINAIFLVVWIFIQYQLQQVMNYYQLAEIIGSSLLFGFQVIFAFFTFIGIFMGLLQDIILKYHRMKKRIEKEKKAKPP